MHLRLLKLTAPDEIDPSSATSNPILQSAWMVYYFGYRFDSRQRLHMNCDKIPLKDSELDTQSCIDITTWVPGKMKEGEQGWPITPTNGFGSPSPRLIFRCYDLQQKLNKRTALGEREGAKLAHLQGGSLKLPEAGNADPSRCEPHYLSQSLANSD